MNSNVTFPAPAPELKLARPSADKWAAAMAEERRQLEEDHDALREREANLRDYEERLRTWQTQLDANRHGILPAAQGLRASVPGLSFTPAPAAPAMGDQGALQVGWEKLHRAREILEAEQSHLREDRLAVRDLEAALKRREASVAEREAQVAERERLVLAAMPPATSGNGASGADPAGDASSVKRMSRAPFEFARAVFGGRK